jgi:peptidoglycan-N-acetylglucosamine deacetylase
MLYAGISWHAEGFSVDLVDGLGGRPWPARRFAGRGTRELIDHLRGFDDLVAVVDSTNGILDGRLMAAGLTVYRADPHQLGGDRPLFSSVPAPQIASVAQRGLAALTRLQRDRGTQTGREHDIEAFAVASTAELAARTAAGTCVSRGGDDRMEIALTFDDGPQPPYTGQVLDILARYGVPATFFCTGMYAAAWPEYLVRMREEGHTVANHTWSHPFLFELTRPQLTAQLDRTNEAIAAATGAAPTLFRPPYGSRTPEVLRWLAESGLTTVLWDVAPDDWQLPGADTIAARVLDEARPGSIVLLHDSGGDRSQTVAALAPIIEGLLGRGFTFVPVDRLRAADLAGRR